MKCEKCDDLLGAYKLSVTLFSHAVQRLAGLVGADRDLALQKADHLRRKCRQASDDLLVHWHHDHHNLAEELRGFSVNDPPNSLR